VQGGKKDVLKRLLVRQLSVSVRTPLTVPDSNGQSYRMHEQIPEAKPEDPPEQNQFYDNTPIDVADSPGNPKLSLIALNKFKRPKTT
jgi:hypothetical protein